MVSSTSRTSAWDADVTSPTAALPPPEVRGRLDIADGVVETIARKAAATVSHTRHVSGLDRITSNDLPRARVTITAGHVVATLTVGACWPSSATGVARRVQEVVSRQIRDCTGLTVGRVDVDVHFIEAHEPTTARRVQ
jgi:uncharacterized alkaline shock family protein YloU